MRYVRSLGLRFAHNAAAQNCQLCSGPPLLWTRLVVVNELPVARETLLVRLLGAGAVLQQAIGELKEDLRTVVEHVDDEATLATWIRILGTRGADEIAAAIRSFRAS